MKGTQDCFYNIQCSTYQQSIEVSVFENCNGWTAINTGDEVVTVEGIILLPALVAGATGAAIQIGGNRGEIYKGRIQITFAGGGVAPSCQLIQKYYIAR